MDKNLIDQVKNIIIKAGEIAINVRQQGLVVEFKENNSAFTNADKEVSEYIFSNLSKLTPFIPIICEEKPLVNVANYDKFWLIDPIDGTSGFIKNSDRFTVNIALINNKEAEYGFIYLPVEKELYYTNEQQKFVLEKNGQYSDHVIYDRCGYTAIVSQNNLNLATQSYLKEHNFSQIITMPSSIKLCLIAKGVGDVYPRFSDTMEWDIAAGHAIIKASGGNVYTTNGRVMKYGKKDFLNSHFIATNKKELLIT